MASSSVHGHSHGVARPRKTDPGDAPAAPSDLPPPAQTARPERGAGRYALVSSPPLHSGSFPAIRRPLTVLVVEDDEGVAAIILEVLKQADHHPVHVRSLDAARDYIDRQQPDVITLDLQLDGELGSDLLGELAGQMGMPPIVVVSASRLAEGIAGEHGVTFVRKPFDIDDLTHAIERAARL